ncbi:hypothetical protein MPTA5024_10990 [Microbispora sp. ATCC PTA-5024]|nr:hypothetical protein MPTA5024_10990 [Microbispora sp. ATCC PTA-5024]
MRPDRVRLPHSSSSLVLDLTCATIGDRLPLAWLVV